MRLLWWLLVLLLLANPLVALEKQEKDHEVDTIDLFLIFNQINQLNQVIETYKKDPEKSAEISLYNDQKNDLIKSLTSKVLNERDKIGIDIRLNLKEQEKIKKRLAQSIKGDDFYTFIKDRLALDSLLIDEILYQFIEKIRSNIDVFSEEKDVESISNAFILRLGQFKLYALPKNLDSIKTHELEELFSKYQLRLATYTEVLRYIKNHPKEVLPKNLIMEVNMDFVLNKISSLLPFTSHSLQVSKIVLSLTILVLLLGLRRLITILLARMLDFIFELMRQNKEMHLNVQNNIISPVSIFLLIFSCDVSLDIFYYPNTSPHKISMWVGVVYIMLLAWLVMALFKGYGTALVTNIATKSTHNFRKEVINLILKIVYFLIFIVALLAILKQLGFNISAIIASLGIGGLAVALAVKDVLANFFASVILLLDNSFSQGDWIVCGEVEGTVVEMGLRRTTIRAFDNALLFVPNSELAGKSIRNWSRRKVGRRIKMQIGLAYNSSQSALELCVKDIRGMLEEHPKIANAKDSALQNVSDYRYMFKKDIVSINDFLGYKSNLFVFLDEFAPSSINILVYCFSKTVVWGEWLEVKEDVMLKIMEIVEKHRLSFAFPSQSLYVESLPEITLKKGSKAY
ncbi:mechanosensitive ion channel family protein [Helicobacter cetorum]|uniref:mechanosensitive ion channel family protein n=1 Tax=Helicobacter cetorum TaxID=138563 RepID=UPI00030693CF|nr:mechanosensitive ion channel family protein [Helicobacter cetorum]